MIYNAKIKFVMLEVSCVYRGKGFKPCSLVIPFKFCVLWLGKNEVKFGKIGVKFGKKENNYLPLFFRKVPVRCIFLY